MRGIPPKILSPSLPRISTIFGDYPPKNPRNTAISSRDTAISSRSRGVAVAGVQLLVVICTADNVDTNKGCNLHLQCSSVDNQVFSILMYVIESMENTTVT